MKRIVNSLSLSLTFVICLVAGQSAFASPQEEVIVSCKGSLKGGDQIPSIYGKKIDLSIVQTPQNKNYYWLLKVKGDITDELLSNGPINPDGTTLSKNGDENFVFFNTPTEGVVLKKDNGNLVGNLSFVQQDPQKPEEWLLVEYALDCQRVGGDIDPREAIIYNARSEITDNIMDQKNTWINGVGVNPSPTMQAVGIGIFSQDEAQKQRFITEFKKRGLLVEKDNTIFYNYKTDDGSSNLIPMTFTITGDVTPLP